MAHTDISHKSQEQTQGPWALSSPPPCLICPGPCFYPAAVLSSLPLVKEYLHLYSPKMTFGLLKATTRLIWTPVKMCLTPLPYVLSLSPSLFPTLVNTIIFHPATQARNLRIILNFLLPSFPHSFVRFCYFCF